MRGVPRHLLSSVLRSSEKVCGKREKGRREASATCWQDSGGKNKMKQAPKGSWCHVAQTGFYCWDNNKTHPSHTHRETRSRTHNLLSRSNCSNDRDADTPSHVIGWLHLSIFMRMCTYSLGAHLCVNVSMCVCHCFVPMPFLVHVSPHLFSKRQSGKPSTMQPPSKGLLCIVDPHDVSSLALSLHSCPCSHII